MIPDPRAPHPPSLPHVVHVTPAPVTLRFLSGQAEFFRAHGILLEAVSSPGEELDEFGRREKVAAHGVGMSRTITPLRDLVSLYRLWRLFRKLRPAAVDAHTPKGGLLGVSAAWLARVPVRVYHVHGLPVLASRGARRALLRWSDRLIGRLAGRVLCVSRSLYDAALEERLFPSAKLKVLARGTVNGLDSESKFNPAVVGLDAGREVREALKIPHEVRVLGFIGRVVYFKGVVELATAWGELRERYPDLHLVIAGPFESKDAVPAGVVDELAADSRARLVKGWLDETSAYYAALDVLALPSHREGFPYALLEASAMGLPVVATRVPGCIDAVVDGVTGTLVPPYDARALAAAIAAYLDDPALRHEHGRAGREWVVREFDRQEVWKALLEEYCELFTARPAGARTPTAAVSLGECQGGPDVVNPSVISVVKRSVDLAAAAAGLILFAPVFAAVGSAIFLTMGQPVLFRQVRAGYRGKLVTVLKFRTMRLPDRPDRAPENDIGRVTALGRLLRATGLDELPQLWNILRGDLSLVGPRPLPADYLPLYTAAQARRHEVRPGITGWAQVHGRNAVGWEEKFRRDVWYVDHWSPWLDLKILISTLLCVMRSLASLEEGEPSRPFLGPGGEGP